MKATELERIDRTYAVCLDTLFELQKASERAERDLGPLEDTVKQTKKEWEKHQDLNKLRRKLQEYHEKSAWARYAEQMEQYETLAGVSTSAVRVPWVLTRLFPL
jgi:predicted translin family RNA/ssDNA-binding protein